MRTIIIVAAHKNYYSQFTSRLTSISENEISNIPLCNVRHLNGMLNISLEIFPKKTQTEKKKDSKYVGNNKILFFLKYLML